MSKLSGTPSVAICIATYKRPLGLQRLLESLRELQFQSDVPDWRIVIVDNDSAARARDLVNDFRQVFPVPVLYEVQPKRGIASTRNRGVQLAANVDFIAFIDDDEVAHPRWLDELLNVQNNLDVDVVNGPVLPRFEQPVPSWVLRGHFYSRRRFPTGTKIDWANTGNVLIRTYWLQAVPGPFNEKLNLTGGEDSVFFSQICRMGAKMVWADNAIVEEFNPPSRISANWILRRAFRAGNGTSISETVLSSSLTVAVIRVLKSLLHILTGVLLLVPASIYRGYAGLIQSLTYISRGIGELSGVVGIRYLEYER